MTQTLYSIVLCLVIGGTAGYLGSLMITKRTALIGDAFGHVALPGIALALLYGFDVSLGAFAALIIGVILIWYFERNTKLPIEALTGIVFTASVAIAFLFLPEEQVSTALIGDITMVSAVDVIIALVLCSILIIVLEHIYQKVLLMNMSELLAKIEHINTSLVNLLFLYCVAIIVAIGIQITGSLLIGALVITPAATARNIAKNMNQYVYGSFILGSSFSIAGFLLHLILGYSAGPMTILVATSAFILSMIGNRR
jgi:ABC-type Mn2+/Zn2+ transport system permease subunit